MTNRYVSVDFTTKGATRVTGALKDIERQAEKTAAVTSASFRSSAGSTDASMRKLAGAANQARGGLKGLAGGIGSLGGGGSLLAVAGLTSVAAGLRSVVEEAREQAKAGRLTEAVLKSTGFAAGVSAKHVADLASTLSKTTGIEDDVIQSGENLLLTFTAIRNEAGKGNDVFDQATQVALDMSAAFGSDLQGNIVRVGKALQDPIGGLQALRKVGVNVTELTDKVHKLVASGDELGARKAILKELQTEFGGAAAAAADPFSKLGTQIKDLKQAIGEEVIPKILGIGKAGATVGRAFQSANSATEGALGKLVLVGVALPIVAAGANAAAAAFARLAVAEGAAAGAGVLGTSLTKLGAGAVVAGAGVISFTATKAVLDRFIGGSKPNVDALTESFKNLATQNVVDANAADALGGNFQKLAGSLRTMQGSTIEKGFGLSGSSQQAVKDIDAANEAIVNLAKTAGPAVAQKALDRLAVGLFRNGVSASVIGPQFHRAYVAIDQARIGAKGAADATNEASFAYLGLASSVTTAAGALDAINTKYFAGIKAQVSADTARTNVQEAVKAITNPDTGSSSSGGGSTQTATAAALQRADKEATLRDALQGVADADRDAKTAQAALADARKNYDTVLQGVARNTKEAKEAEEAYTQAQNNAKSAVLDLRDARRQLADALEAQRIAGREANENLGGANRGLASAKLDLADAKQALADAREDEDPVAIARAQIALGEALQRVRDATQAVAEARKAKSDASKRNSKEDDDVKRAQIGVTEATINNERAVREQTEALRILNGTLHGFPPASNEAKEALNQYRAALQTSREATDTANDSTKALERAQADLAGQLDAVGHSAGTTGRKIDGLSTRVNNAKIAILQLAAADAELARQMALKAGQGTYSAVALGVLAEINGIKAAIQGVPALEQAFQGVLNELTRQYIASSSAAAFQSGTSLVPGAAGHSVLGHVAGLAAGGPVNARTAYVVGEKGPELFIPQSSGEIVPNKSLANSRPFGSTVVVQNIVYNHDGPLIGDQVEAWLERTMANARGNGRDLDRRR